MTRRPIVRDDRSGVLVPANLERFSATWIAPDPLLDEVVETYWHVRWSLGDERIVQRVVEAPAVTLSIERGAVPAHLVRTTPGPRSWSRVIEGSGEVLGIRLRPAGFGVLSDAPLGGQGTEPIDRSSDPRLARLLETIAAAGALDDRVRAADAAIAARLAERPPSRIGLVANAAMDALAAAVRTRSAALLQDAGRSDRTVQRALRATVGMGPKAAARRIRLQEVARLLAGPDVDLAGVAAALGYADQSHLTNDFRSATGVTPGRYVAALRAAAG